MVLDCIVAGGWVHDGNGRLPFRADVGLAGDRIVEIGDLSQASAGRRIDARGLALCPGFIDVHSHADLTVVRPDHTRLLEPLIRQGITTFVGGNCGLALAPIGRNGSSMQADFFKFFLGGQDPVRDAPWTTFGEMLDHLERQGTMLNVGVLAPHGMLRLVAMGDRRVPADVDDRRAMVRLLEECLESGALGMSTGLQYFPGLASEMPELVELARVVHRYNGVFTSHMRSYNDNTIDRAIDEVLEVGQRADVPVQISHLFWVPVAPWPINVGVGRAMRAVSGLYRRLKWRFALDVGVRRHVERLEREARRGAPVSFDAMPTSAAFTHLLAFFPPWLAEGSSGAALARLRDPDTRKRLRRDIEHGEVRWPHRGRSDWSLNLIKLLGWDSIQVMSVVTEANQRVLGRSLVELGEEAGKHPFDAACDLLLQEDGRVLVFATTTFPGDPFVESALRSAVLSPNGSITTDTILLGFGKPSHLFHDCYPRFLGGYVRDQKLLRLPEAIRKCTSLPARQLQLRERGEIRRGYKADLVLFDPATIGSNSTPAEPARHPTGIHAVLVNGATVLDGEGLHLERLHGQVLRN
jgi:N-acyl-D-aspartate/D-glutamate deacylase